MTWRFEPVSRLRCHRPSPIVRASATRVPNALPPDCTNTPPAIGAPGSGAFPVALRAPSNAPDPIKQTAAIRSPDQGHAVPCRRWTPDLCGNRPPLTAERGDCGRPGAGAGEAVSRSGARGASRGESGRQRSQRGGEPDPAALSLVAHLGARHDRSHSSSEDARAACSEASPPRTVFLESSTGLRDAQLTG